MGGPVPRAWPRPDGARPDAGLGRARRRPPPLRPGEHGHPPLEQVERRPPQAAVPEPRVRRPLPRPGRSVVAGRGGRAVVDDHRGPVGAAQVARQAVVGVPLGAEAAQRGRPPHRFALLGVARQQFVPRDPAGRPGQPPAQLVPVVDGGVQPGPGVGRHAVRGVADEEARPGAERARHLGGHREPRRPEHVRRPSDGQRQRRLRRLPPGPDVPPPPGPQRQQHTLGVGVLDEVQRARLRRHPVGAEEGQRELPDHAEPLHADAQRRAHGAARPVGADHEPGPHPHTPDDRAHPVARRPQRRERRTEAHGAAEAAHLVDQHRLQVVLRDDGREGRARGEDLPHRRPGQRHHLVRRVGQAVGDRDGRLAGDAPPQRRVRDPPAAQDFHGVDGDAGRPRHGRRPGPALDDEHPRAVAQRGERGREARRPRADDEHISGEHAATVARRPPRHVRIGYVLRPRPVRPRPAAPPW